jgi:hypothetical protein
MDPHWFGSQDPDTNWNKKLDPDPNCNQRGSTKLWVQQQVPLLRDLGSHDAGDPLLQLVERHLVERQLLAIRILRVWGVQDGLL